MRGTRQLVEAICCSALAASSISAQGAGKPAVKQSAPAQTTPATALPVLAAIRDLTPREHRVQAFVLAAPSVLQVVAVGAQLPSKAKGGAEEAWVATGWILDARSRQVAWDLRSARSAVSSNGVHRYTGPISLPAGTYELHYASYPATSVSNGGELLDNLKSIIVKNKQPDEVTYNGPFISDGAYKQFGVTLRGVGRAAGFAELTAARKSDVTLVASIHPVRHDAVERTAFTLGQAATVDVQAIGELRENRTDDIGWIINADTRKDVWRMSYEKSVAAGGDARNRLERVPLTLPAGRYVAYFTTDDRYDPAEWTAVPPPDPDGYGLTLRISNPAARAAFKLFDWKPVPATGTVASITKAGDDANQTADFTLTQPTTLQLYALGEASGNELSDFATLTDLDQHRRVWAMKAAETIWAGGAQKNREFDGFIRLPAGHYRLTYRSDDSHSFADWNAAAPVEPEYWGASLWPAPNAVPTIVVTGAAPISTLPALASILHVGDNLNAQVGFRLADSGAVRVRAIGEGSGNGMNDFASIEDAKTHRVVWTMRYSQTEPAGGSEKNRLFDGVVDLKAGNYLLRWRSDDSHSWNRWNSDAPDDPESWGVRVVKVARTVGNP